MYVKINTKADKDNTEERKIENPLTEGKRKKILKNISNNFQSRYNKQSLLVIVVVQISGCHRKPEKF